MMTPQELEAQLMRLIVLSGKAMGDGLSAIENADINHKEKTEELWKSAREQATQAHDVQTTLIEKEIRGEGVQVSLLAVHAQDHFMNTHFLTQIGEILLRQQYKIQELEKKIKELEKR